MEHLLASLRAAAEPTRLRLLALAARGAFCVMEFTEILGQSQPRLSRHLKLLCDCGLLDRVREGANVWFALPHRRRRRPAARTRRPPARRRPDPGGRPPPGRPGPRRTRPHRLRKLSPKRRRLGRDARPRPARPGGRGRPAVADPARPRRPAARHRHRHRPGARTARPRVRQALGVDASKAMLALARARLSGPDFAHCAVRLADMYRLPLAEPAFDTVVLQMVLHHAEDPAGAMPKPPASCAPAAGCWSSTWRNTTSTDLTGKPRPSLARILRRDHERKC